MCGLLALAAVEMQWQANHDGIGVLFGADVANGGSILRDAATAQRQECSDRAIKGVTDGDPDAALA